MIDLIYGQITTTAAARFDGKWLQRECHVSTCKQTNRQTLFRSSPGRQRPTILADTRYWPNIGLMLGQCRRQWVNIFPALIQYITFADKYPCRCLAISMHQRMHNAWKNQPNDGNRRPSLDHRHAIAVCVAQLFLIVGRSNSSTFLLSITFQHCTLYCRLLQGYYGQHQCLYWQWYCSGSTCTDMGATLAPLSCGGTRVLQW